MISYQKFRVNNVVRSRSVQKRMSEDENDSIGSSLKLVKKQQFSQCKDSSTGDQSTMSISDAFYDGSSSPLIRNSIHKLSQSVVHENHKISQSMVIPNSKYNIQSQVSTPSPTLNRQKQLLTQPEQIEEFHKNYQILNSDSPSKRRRILYPNVNTFDLKQSRNSINKTNDQFEYLDNSHVINRNDKNMNNNNINNDQINNTSNFYLTNIPSSFEDHYKNMNQSIPLQRNLRAQSLSTSPKKQMNSALHTPMSRIKTLISPQKSRQQIKEEEIEKQQAEQERQIQNFDNLVKHRLQNQMIELKHNEIDDFYNASSYSKCKLQAQTQIPYSLYLMKKDRELLISRLKEIHKEPQNKGPIVKDNIIKEVRIKNLQKHKILDYTIQEEQDKYKDELVSKNPYKSTIYDILALNQKSQSRVKTRLHEELPAISRFNACI